MAGKRSAESDLNHTNWAEEDEPEDAGLFKKASHDILQKRVIKTAKRRNLTSNQESNAKGIFGSFTAFNKTPAISTAFAFLNNTAVASDNSPNVNGINTGKNISVTSDIHTNNIDNASEHEKVEKDEYYAKLKGLNESVSIWIKKHVDANPLINLKPIFADYEKYFKDLENKSQKSIELNKPQVISDDLSKHKKQSSIIFKSTDTDKQVHESKFTMSPFLLNTNLNKNEAKIDNLNSKSDTSLSLSEESKNTNSATTFTFGTNLIASSSNTPLFTSSETNANNFNMTGRHFSSAYATQTTNHQEHSENKEDEPPKVEFTPVIEDGHTYTVRCKVFVKNQDSFGDRGVGVLYLKPISNHAKTQLIVRADTNLGNLLCNFILSNNIPTKRMGKKDVMLVCLPTPESKPPPVPILLRVKSSEQADELLMELEKHKK